MNRDEFMELVYETFADEPDNVLANGIIEAADAYVEHEKAQLFKEGTTKDATPTIQPVATDTNVGDTISIQPEERTEKRTEMHACDLISKQDAINAIVNCTNCGDEKTLRAYVAKHNLDNGWTGGVLEAIDAIEDLPSAQPEPHEGHWIPHETPDGGEQYECSRCGVLWEFNDGTPEDNEAYFCPKCGKKLITK